MYKHVFRGKIHKLVQFLNNLVTFAKQYGKAESARSQQGQDPPSGTDRQWPLAAADRFTEVITAGHFLISFLSYHAILNDIHLF